MAVIRCKMCGGNLVLSENQSVAECEYCGSRQTVPSADDEKKLTLFARANRLRFACEFDKAAGVYETIVAEFPEEAESYWGLVLCKYGIEYVDDPATGRKVPTCHRSSFDSILQDSDFDMALEYADVSARRIYREEAKQIEEIRKNIIAVSNNEQPYDIFICYKETDETGSRTLDSVLAQDIYDALRSKGYRVFFSRITLEDKLGQEYEPYIFAALNSAKIMLAVGTDYEFYNAVWVKNEWSRFLKLMTQDKSRHLIPCYKGIDAYDMPQEFARLQAQDLGKVGAMQDLLRGIAKLMPKQEQETAAVTAAVPGAGAMVMRGQFALDDGDFQKAAEFFERALDQNPRDGSAYLGKVLAALHISSSRQLEDYYLQIRDDKDFDRAIRFSDAAASDSLQKVLEQSHRKYLLKCVVTGICKYARMREKAEKLEAQRIALEKQRELDRIEQERREEEERIAREKREEAERLAREKREEKERIARKKREEEAKKRAEAEQLLRQQQKENSLRLKPIRERVQKASGLILADDNEAAAITIDGKVQIAGDYLDGEPENISGWQNIVAVTRADGRTFGLTADGKVLMSRLNGYESVLSWQDIVAVSAGYNHVAGLTAAGKVVTRSFGGFRDCNLDQNKTNSWLNMVAISAGVGFTVGLTADGLVKAAGSNIYGECSVYSWRDIVAISTGSSHTVGLTADGRVYAVGDNYNGQCNVADWQDIVAVSAGRNYTVGVTADGRVVSTNDAKVHNWDDIVAVSAGKNFILGLTADGRVLSTGSVSVSGWKLFQNIGTLDQERMDVKKRKERRQAYQCQHCGGSFKGFFVKKCSVCGKLKDYC